MARARVIEHPGWELGQLSSLLAGLRDAIDEPLLEAAARHAGRRAAGASVTVAEVIAALASHARRSCGPRTSTSLRAGGPRHGHPVISIDRFSRICGRPIPGHRCEGRFAIHRDRIVDVEVQDAGASRTSTRRGITEGSCVLSLENSRPGARPRRKPTLCRPLNALPADLRQHLGGCVAVVAAVKRYRKYSSTQTTAPSLFTTDDPM